MRKNAYKNKMTMSDYVRRLIQLDNQVNNLKKSHCDSNKVMDEIENIFTVLGRKY